MSTLYFLAFAGVCVIVLGVMFDAVMGVSSKPVWHAAQARPPVVELPTRPVQPIAILEVEPRHSAFAGLTNNEEWRMTA